MVKARSTFIDLHIFLSVFISVENLTYLGQRLLQCNNLNPHRSWFTDLMRSVPCATEWRPGLSDHWTGSAGLPWYHSLHSPPQEKKYRWKILTEWSRGCLYITLSLSFWIAKQTLILLNQKYMYSRCFRFPSIKRMGGGGSKPCWQRHAWGKYTDIPFMLSNSNKYGIMDWIIENLNLV